MHRLVEYESGPNRPALPDQVAAILPPALQFCRDPVTVEPRAPRLSVRGCTHIFIDRRPRAGDEPFELTIEPGWEEHVFSMPLRRSTVVYNIGNGQVVDGGMMLGQLPFARRPSAFSRKVYVGGADVFHLGVSNKLLRERLRMASDVGSDGQVHLFGPQVSSDRIVRELLIAGAEAASACDELCLESIGVALAEYTAVRFARVTPLRRIPALSKARLKRVVDYIEENLVQRITLAELSAMAGLSRPHFGAQFKAATGRTPYSYVTYRRLCAAQAMLTRRDLSVNAVALAVGFSNPAHFIACFRKHTGQTPSRWRRSFASAPSAHSSLLPVDHG